MHMLMLLSVHMTSVPILVWFNNFTLTTSFYWSYTLLLKSPFLMCSVHCHRIFNVVLHCLQLISQQDYAAIHVHHIWETQFFSCIRHDHLPKCDLNDTKLYVYVNAHCTHTACHKQECHSYHVEVIPKPLDSTHYNFQYYTV